METPIVQEHGTDIPMETPTAQEHGTNDETLTVQEHGTNVANETPIVQREGKQSVVIDYLEAIDIFVFDDDFDPFFGVGNGNDTGNRNVKDTDFVDDNGSDSDDGSDFQVELQDIVEDVDVDMN